MRGIQSCKATIGHYNVLTVGQTAKRGMWTSLKTRFDWLAGRLSVGARWVFAPDQSTASVLIQESHSRFLPGASVVALVAILLATFLLPYLNTGYATNDDMENATLSYSHYVQRAGEHGRIFFMTLHGPTAIGAHVCREMVVTKFFSLLMIATNFILFGWLVHRLARNTAVTWLSLLAWSTLHCDSWEHYLITAYPIIFTLPLSLFFLSLIAYDYGIERRSTKLLFLSAFLYLVTLNYCEIFYIFGLCFLPILYRHPAASCKSLSLHGIFLLLMLLVYGAWRLYSPSQYDGNVLDASFRLKDFFRTLLSFSLSNFPIYHYDTPDEIRRFSSFQGASFNPLYGLPILADWLQNFRNFEPAWLMRATLAAGAAWILLRRFALKLSLSTWMVIGTSAVCLIFLPNLLFALTPKYQRWVREGSNMYMASYFSFFGICLFMGAFACHLTAITRIRPVRAVTTVVFAALVFAGTLRFSAWNDAEVASKVYSHRKWEFFDDFLSSDLFRELPAGSIIYAPSLTTRTCGIAVSYPGYWRDYVHYKTGRKINILTEKEEMEASLRDKTLSSAPRYYLKYSPNHAWSETCLLFASVLSLQIVEDTADPIRVIGNEAHIFLHAFELGSRCDRILLFQDESGSRAVEVLNRLAYDSAKRFTFHLQGKNIRLHSAFVVNNRDAFYSCENPRLDYGPGFCMPETVNTGRVVRAYGKDSKLTLINTADRVIEADLSFQLADWNGNKSALTVQTKDACLSFSPPPRNNSLPVVLPLRIPPEGMTIDFHYKLDGARQGETRNLPSTTFSLFNPVVRKRLNSSSP